MLENIEVLTHSSIRINKGQIIYVDPYNIVQNYNDADIIFITHSHYDHYSEEDIDKVKKEDTIYVVTEDIVEKLLKRNVQANKIIVVNPEIDFMPKSINNISFEVVSAYNINKKFHPKENKWVGYIITIDQIRYYIAGDTDITEENKKVKCDVAFVPVGGTYTMNYKEAAELVNNIKPKVAVPIHYGSVVGTIEDANNFVDLLDKDIEGKIQMQSVKI